MRNEKFWPRVLLTCFLFSTIVARADYVSGCTATLEYRQRCSSDNGCQETVTIPTCIPGNVGSVCQQGGGLCCGAPYDTDSADGQCGTGDAKQAENHPASPAKALVSATKESRNRLAAQDLPRRVIFAPDRCARSYGAIEPEFFDKRGT
jgi:hypothetical protein